MRDLYEMIRARFADMPLFIDEPLSRHTTFMIGGPADFLAMPGTEDELLSVVAIARDAGAEWFIMGNGSNLLVRDGGFRGLMISTKNMANAEIRGGRIVAQAGAMLPKIASLALSAGLSGLEFASGIPGSLGGAIRMNAGAYGAQMADVVISCRVLIDGEIITFSGEELEFSYRASAIREDDVVLSAELALTRADPADISAKMEDLNGRRRDKQPLNYPSAGSAFKRPPGRFAGALIEEAGLKGAAVGGARVSEKHAGFIVNAGGATADDVLRLIEHVKRSVFEKTGVMLASEVHVIGEEE